MRRLLIVGAALSLLLGSVLIATNLDGGSDAGALPEHPTAPPPPPPTPTPRTGPRPALPTPRPASPPGARPSIIPSPPLLPTRPPTPAQTPVVTDRFGTVLGPERVRFTSEDGGFSFLHPVGWTIERLEDTHLGSTWRLHNTRPGTRPGSVADDAVRIDITFSEDATEQDPATGDVSSARSLEQLVSEVSVPPQFGFLRLEQLGDQTAMRYYTTEHGGPGLRVTFAVGADRYAVKTQDSTGPYGSVFEEIISSMEFIR